jgi:hypothetical protein
MADWGNAELIAFGAPPADCQPALQPTPRLPRGPWTTTAPGRGPSTLYGSSRADMGRAVLQARWWASRVTSSRTFCAASRYGLAMMTSLC